MVLILKKNAVYAAASPDLESAAIVAGAVLADALTSGLEEVVGARVVQSSKSAINYASSGVSPWHLP